MNRKYKIYFVILVLFLLVSNLLQAKQSGKINIAVMDLEVQDVIASAKTALSDRLRSELFNSGRFAVMERNQMNEILKEQGFQQSGCTSDECIVEAGRLLGVDRMIGGSIGKVGTIYTVSLRMIDIETGRIMLTKTEDCNCPIEQVLTTSLRNVALKMAGLTPDNAPKPVFSDEQVSGQGDFYFKSTPTGAKVYIDDKPLSGVTPITKEGIPAGTHQIRMEKGYYSASQTVFLEPNEFKKVDLVLVKAKGGLKIVTTPLEADIFFDNKSMGMTPHTLTGLDAGEHLLKLVKQGYVNYEKLVFVQGGEVKRLDIKMEKVKPATLRITSQPPNCEVYINNEQKGRTPMVAHDLMPGTVQIKLTNPMYQDYLETFVLGNGESKNIEPELKKKTGGLIIKSDPLVAEVEIDGEIKGQTPLTLDKIEFGTYNIKVIKKDFQTEEQKVDITTTRSKTIFMTLKQAKGELTISGNPNGAYVLINKRHIGNIPLQNYEISKGSYDIKIKAKGYEKQKQTISISPNEKKNIAVQLKIKSKSKALARSLFIPGLGQHYLEKPGKAVLFPLMEIGAIAGAFVFNDQYNKTVKEYNSLKESYSTALDLVEIDDYFSQMETKYNDIESAELMRNICIGAAVGIWLWNIVDAALFGPDTESISTVNSYRERKVKLYSDQSNGFNRIGISFDF